MYILRIIHHVSASYCDNAASWFFFFDKVLCQLLFDKFSIGRKRLKIFFISTWLGGCRMSTYPWCGVAVGEVLWQLSIGRGEFDPENLKLSLYLIVTLHLIFETCATTLYPLMESCLPEDFIRVWQRSNRYDTNATS